MSPKKAIYEFNLEGVTREMSVARRKVAPSAKSEARSVRMTDATWKAWRVWLIEQDIKAEEAILWLIANYVAPEAKSTKTRKP